MSDAIVFDCNEKWLTSNYPEDRLVTLLHEAVQIKTEDGYVFDLIDGEWTNGDMTWGDTSDVIESILVDDMTFTVLKRVSRANEQNKK